MIRQLFQRLALILLGIYLAVLPGSTLTVALDRVPAWGGWMGGALLMLQGAAVLCWLLGGYGRRGASAGLLILLLAWGVEHIGVTTGLPFGQYRYTAALQPQLLGVVPLAIACAWLMVVVGAWQLALTLARPPARTQVQGYEHKKSPQKYRIEESRKDAKTQRGVRFASPTAVGTRRLCVPHPGMFSRVPHPFILAATLVLLLDLQIEMIATKINSYWVWSGGGAYYGIPSANFVAWWLVGLGMALIVDRVLAQRSTDVAPQGTGNLMRHALRFLPAYLYMLNTLMFTVIDLARGYVVAGTIGVALLLVVGRIVLSAVRGRLALVVVRPGGDA